MSNKNTSSVNNTNASAKDVDETTVPHQNAGETKVTVIGQVDGKDVIVVGEDESQSMADKFKGLLRNKKVLAGIGAFAVTVAIMIIKAKSGEEFEGFEPTFDDVVEPEDENPEV